MAPTMPRTGFGRSLRNSHSLRLINTSTTHLESLPRLPSIPTTSPIYTSFSGADRCLTTGLYAALSQPCWSNTREHYATRREPICPI